MARSETITVPADTWTQITNSDAAEVTFQNQSDRGYRIIVNATADETAPSTVDGISYDPDQGEYLLSLAEAFPGVSGAARMWVYCEQDVEVFVSHG